MMTLSKRDIFLSTYRRQNFTFPNSMMHYIAKNPKNTKVYQKMIKICKYFFIKNPILIISDLVYDQNRWGTTITNNRKNIDINRVSCKLWITYQLYVYSENLSNISIASSIIPKIYQCDVKYLFLDNQVISFHEFMFLCSSVKDLTIKQVTVKNDDGIEVAFEELIKQLPYVTEIDYAFSTPSNNTSKNTFKKLWKIQHLSNCDSFVLDNIPGNFDIDSFYSFMKENKNTYVFLKFSDEISEEYKSRLEAMIDEIIGTKNHEYKTPCIDYSGIDEEKDNKLWNIV